MNFTPDETLEDNYLRAEHILEGLNPIQRKAVEHDKGPMVIFAGAGSGKTRIITTRIAYLIAKGVRPYQILAVTFTNKAAKEMKERVQKLTLDGRLVHISTFHAACARWLREFAESLGFDSDFSILDEKDSVAALKEVQKRMNIDSQELHPSEYLNAIKKMKMLGWDPAQAMDHSARYMRVFPPFAFEVYRAYQEYLSQCNAMDFADLLMNMLLLLRTNKEVRDKLQVRYRYIMVDEYQDTNPTQFKLLSHLINEEQNFCVVGDDDQSIYSWRGADPSNILEFTNVFPTAVTIKLEQNYRCAGNIISAANALIEKNKIRADKKLWTDNHAGDLIQWQLSYDGELETEFVVDQIRAERSRFEYKDIAIFYRTNAQSRQLEESLRMANIPHKIYGSLRFYDRAEIKDIIAYFRLLVNETDNIAFCRVINTPTRGAGKKLLDDLLERARELNLPYYACLEKLIAQGEVKASTKLSAFLRDFHKLKQEMSQLKLYEILNKILEITDYRVYLEKKHKLQAEEKIENIHELGAALAEYQELNEDATISEWLKDVSLAGSEEETKEDQCVSLMTLHSAKGLEFRRVFIVGVEDKILPHANSLDDKGQLEEERRLFYVGLTRAKEKVSLHGARKRRVYNRWLAHAPSRFLKEIPEELFLHGKSTVKHAVSFGSKAKTWQEGAFVSHPTFGKGTISGVDEQSFATNKVLVQFKDFGMRKVPSSQLKQISGLD